MSEQGICLNCGQPHDRKNKKGKDRRVSWVKCPLCDFSYCVECMPFIDGCGRCPKCYRLKEQKNEV